MSCLSRNQSVHTHSPTPCKICSTLHHGTMEEMLELTFRMYDMDGNGQIEKNEVKQIMTVSKVALCVHVKLAQGVYKLHVLPVNLTGNKFYCSILTCSNYVKQMLC